MALDLVILNSTLSENGWHAKRKSNTKITTTGNWSESRVSKSPYPRREYTIPFKHIIGSNREYLREFYDLRIGPTIAFLIFDRDENYLNAVPLGTGDGTTTTFYIQRTITDGVRTVVRPILHPVVTGTAIPAELQGINPPLQSVASNKVTDNGTVKTEGVHYTVNASTGAVVFASAPAAGHTLLISTWYLTAVRFSSDQEFDMALSSLYGEVDITLLEVFNE